MRWLLLVIGLSLSLNASAQGYPMKPVRLIVTFAAGGGADFVGRTLGSKLAERLGQPVVVENRAGANGAIGAELVARAPADGYTLLIGAAGTVAVAPHLNANLPFDTFKDFAPIALVATSPFVVTVHPQVPAKSVRELIQLAKSRPGKLNFGSSGVGGSPQLAGELFKSMAGVELVHVAYKGLAPAITDLIGGQIEVVFADVGLVKAHLDAGKLRGLAVTGESRSPLLPDLPTVDEAGIPRYTAGTWYGLLAPAGTPASVVAKLNEETRKALSDPVVKSALTKQGVETASTSPEEFAKFLREEHDKWGAVIRKAGIKVN
jgi:tripartite-type tricarboxylate transporter receptor subunit TctC